MSLHGTGEHDVVKHREALWQRWRAELSRESTNRGSLDAAERRALDDREVGSDRELVSMIRTFAADCRALLARGDGNDREDGALFSPPEKEPAGAPAAAPPSPPEAVERLEREFQYHISRFNEVEARLALEKMHEKLQRVHAEKLERMLLRRQRYERMIQTLTDKAMRASADGERNEVARAMRQLSSIHTAHPHILTDARFSAIREKLINAAVEVEHRAAASQIVAKERAVAEEIKHLAAAVHHFHKIARTMPHDRDEYHRAEVAYHTIAKQMKSHDEEWMAGLILELADLLADWDEPPPGAQKQVDHFLQSVRSALAHINIEMKQIERGE